MANSADIIRPSTNTTPIKTKMIRVHRLLTKFRILIHMQITKYIVLTHATVIGYLFVVFVVSCCCTVGLGWKGFLWNGFYLLWVGTNATNLFVWFCVFRLFTFAPRSANFTLPLSNSFFPLRLFIFPFLPLFICFPFSASAFCRGWTNRPEIEPLARSHFTHLTLL